MSLIYAPWTDEQVAAPNQWQACDWVHPFTCGERDRPGHKEWKEAWDEKDHGILMATKFGWVCPVCDYEQNWAHDFMLETPPEPPWERNWMQVVDGIVLALLIGWLAWLLLRD